MTFFMTYILTPILLVLLVCCTGFFASSETAFLSIPKITLRQMLKEEGKKKGAAHRIAKLKEDMDGFLTLVLIGTNFVNTLSAALATEFFISFMGENGASVSTATMSILIIIFGEIIPKTFAAFKPVLLAKTFSPVLLVLKKILFPIVFVFSQFTRGVGWLIDKIWTSDEKALTEEELKKLISVGADEGTLEKNEKVMLNKIFEFSDLHVYEIMRHRSFIRMISCDATREEAIKMFLSSNLSRLPVYKENKNEIIGVLYYKDILFAQKEKKQQDCIVEKTMRNVLFVPETLTSIELLQKFKKTRMNFAIALDETGSTSGVVTLDDLLRTVLGRSVDQYTADDIAPEKRIKVVKDKEFLVPGDMKLEDVNEILRLDLESEEWETLGGWLLEQFDSLPQTGEIIVRNGMLFQIEDQSNRRIQLVRIQVSRGRREW